MREASGVKKATVKKRDSKGRASEVAFEVSQMGVGATYTLAYRYRAGDGGLSWNHVSTDPGRVGGCELANGISFSSPTTGWIVSDCGLLVRNAGSWSTRRLR